MSKAENPRAAAQSVGVPLVPEEVRVGMYRAPKFYLDYVAHVRRILGLEDTSPQHGEE